MGWFTCKICGGPTIGGPCSKCREKSAGADVETRIRDESRYQSKQQKPTSKSFDGLHQADTLAEAHKYARDRLNQKGLPDFVTEGYVTYTKDPKLQKLAKAYAAAYKRLERASEKHPRVVDTIDQKGFDEAFENYSKFAEVRDPTFHAARRAYLTAMKKLVGYLGDE